MAETKAIELTWDGDLRFHGGAPGGPATVIDADNATAPGPMLQLLLAAASCSASDVVLILGKMRVELTHLRIAARGVRRETEPRRYESLTLVWHLAGAGLDRAKAERAIALSVEKYCSVMASLAPDIRVTNEVVIEGDPG